MSDIIDVSTNEGVTNLEPLLLTAMCVPHGDPRDPTTKKGLPVILWGDPGIRKSDTVAAISRVLNLYQATVFPSTCAPEDFSGIPVPDGKGKVVRLCPWKKVQDLCEIGEGVLFIDETTTVGAAVQAALMGVVLNRVMGDVELPPGVRPLLAGNPPETAAGGHDITITLANRCCHIYVSRPTVEEWLDWNWDHDIARKKLPDSMYDAEAKIVENWDRNWNQARALVSGYLQRSGQDMLYNLPPEGHPERTRAWRSPRTWYMAECALATAIALRPTKKTEMHIGDEIEDALIAGCIGRGAALTFRTWRKQSDLPTPQDMLANGWAPDKQRLDRSLYAYSALCGYVATLPKGDERLRAGGKAYTMLQQACEAGMADLLYRSGQELVKAGIMPSTLKTKEHGDAAVYVMNRFKSKSEAFRKLAEQTP